MLVPSASTELRGSAACFWCYFPRFGPPSRFQDGYRLKLARRGEKLAEIAGRHGRVAAHTIVSLVLFVPFSGCVSAPELASRASFRLVSGSKNDASLLLLCLPSGL